MTNEHRARLSAFVGIGLGVIGLILEVVDPSGLSWAAIVAGSAILVGVGTLYRLRTQTETKEYEPLG